MIPVRVERHGGTVLALIDRPARRNAASLEVYRALEAALALDAEAYVIAGEGGVFSAGDDVGIFTFSGLGDATEFLVTVTRLFEIVEAVPRPVVAAVCGYALGFGFELALACDAAVAEPDARLGLPEITLGAAPPNAISRGVDVIGRGWVRYLALSGKRWLSGAEAHDLGLVVELHQSGEVLPAALELAGALAADPGFGHAKRILNAGAGAAYGAAPSFMPPLMASALVADSARRYGASADG